MGQLGLQGGSKQISMGGSTGRRQDLYHRIVDLDAAGA